MAQEKCEKSQAADNSEAERLSGIETVNKLEFKDMKESTMSKDSKSVEAEHSSSSSLVQNMAGGSVSTAVHNLALSDNSKDTKSQLVKRGWPTIIAKEKDLEAARALSPLKEFTMFPRLPIELRLNIWGLALPGPRVMETIWVGDNHVYKFRPVPALLHVSSESRALAQETYKKLDITSSQSEDHDEEKSSPYIYIDYDHDLVYLTLRGYKSNMPKYLCSTNIMLKAIRPFRGSSIQHISIRADELANKVGFWAMMMLDLISIKTISIVADDTADAGHLGTLQPHSIAGYVKQHSSRIMKPWRWCRHLQKIDEIRELQPPELRNQSFDYFFGVTGKELKYRLADYRKTMTDDDYDSWMNYKQLVEKLEFIGIDIVRSGMTPPPGRDYSQMI